MSDQMKLEFWYLAGPMSGIENGNVEAFAEAANHLRGKGYLITNPVELDDEDQKPPTGDYHPTFTDWRGFLRRDLNIIMDEWCLGVICLEGWENSPGARLETYVAEAFGKPLYLYAAGDLIVIERTRYLKSMARLGTIIDRSEDDAFEQLIAITEVNGGR